MTEGENSQEREAPLQSQQREPQRESSSAPDAVPTIPSPARVRFADTPSQVPTPVPSIPPLPAPDPPDPILRRSSRVRREHKILTPNDPGMVVLVCVDDCLFFARDKSQIDAVISNLKKRFSLTVEDDVYAFLGIEVEQQTDSQGVLSNINLRQPGSIKKILSATHMENCNSKETPAITTPLGADLRGAPFQENWDYSSVVGMLLYLTHTRPEIQYAVHQVARFCHSPRDSHARAVYRIIRYLKGTPTQGLQFVPDSDSLRLDCYVDADFAGLFGVEEPLDPICSKSRTGYVILLGQCPVVWVSKLQHETALSTAESEYIALSSAMRDLIPLRRLVKTIAASLGTPDLATRMRSTVFEDNNACLSQARAPRYTPRTKHYATPGCISFAAMSAWIRTRTSFSRRSTPLFSLQISLLKACPLNLSRNFANSFLVGNG